jgi:hypothetical protein
VYHGPADSRDIIRQYEWRWDETVAVAADTVGEAAAAAAANAGKRLFKFHALITSYEVIKQDLDRLRKVGLGVWLGFGLG